MSILLTGHRGFVGRAIARHFLVENIAHTSLETTDKTAIRLGEPDSVSAILKNCPPAETIIHCAADIRKDGDTATMLRTNCLGVEQILQAAKQWRTRRLVFLSSASIYAPSMEPMEETSALAPSDAYSASKLYGENRFLAHGNAVCLRIPSPVGPGTPDNRLIVRWVRKILNGQPPDLLGAGTKVQHYLDVRDLARAVALAAAPQLPPGVYNIAGETASNLKLARLCEQTLRLGLGIEHIPRPDPDDEKKFILNTGKIAAAAGFHAQVPLIRSIQAIATDRENPAHL